LVKYTVDTVEHNLSEGMILVAIILFLFLGNVRGAIIVTLTIPFALMFASICLDLSHIPANLLSLGALDFGMLVDGSVVMIENIVRHLSQKDDTRTAGQRDSRCGTRGVAAGVLCARHHHCFVFADFHAAGGRGAAVQADGVDGELCAAGRPAVCGCRLRR
jgi:Cu/Ag efflux pump CusA